MEISAADLETPAGALRAGTEAICEAGVAEGWRRGQYARAGADYAATVVLHPDASAQQRQDALRCLRLAEELDEETAARRARLRS